MIYLMNTTVIPHGADGAWTMESLAPSSAKHLAQRSSEQGRLTSAVGHASSAEAMAAVLQIPVEMNRITVAPQPGDQFLCLRLHARPPEGVVLDLAQLEEIGFSWALLTYLGGASHPFLFAA